METKQCRLCSEVKSVDEFSKDRAKKDGLRGLCKSCDRAKSSKWAKENPEKSRARSRKSQSSYRKRNPEKTKEDNKKFRESNPDYQKNWQSNNRDKQKEYAKSHYYSSGKEKNLSRNRKRRAILANCESEPYSIEDVLKEYGDVCYLCKEKIDLDAPRWTKHDGWERGLHIEHVEDLALGGADTLKNVRPSHGICNLKKSKMKRK
jgi:5-methylcytosine-specific restriction endonuclease McrA